MSDSDLCYISACDALEQFKAQVLSPVELLQALRRRAEEVEPTINAFSYDRFDQVLDQAKRAEAAYARGDSSVRSLEGIPVALKNEMHMAGENTTQGSLVLKDSIDTATHPMVQRLLDAGALIHARTNVPEFSCTSFTHTRLHGTTRNAWNLDYAPGGSSGGSATSLAAGTSTLATGSDMAGSIRMPASFCGVVGMKPSYGRVPEGDLLFSLDTYNQNGPMARTVADCALMFNVINGPYPRDIATLRPKIQVPTNYGDIKGWNIALSFDLSIFSPEHDVVRQTEEVAEALRTLGANVNEIDLGWDESLRSACRAHLCFGIGSTLIELVEENRALLQHYTIELAEASKAVTQEEYLEATRKNAEAYRPLGQVLEEYDALICPTNACTHWPAEGYDRCFDRLFTDFMAWPFNMMSRCPVLSVPSGFAKNGVPTGVQIVGRTFEDDRILQIGANLENVLQWPDWRPEPLTGAAAT